MGKKLTFEKAIEQLEQIIEGIESGDTHLEESLAKYEQGMKLIGHCRKILTSAEKRIAELTIDDDGQLAQVEKSDPPDSPDSPDPPTNDPPDDEADGPLDRSDPH